MKRMNALKFIVSLALGGILLLCHTSCEQSQDFEQLAVPSRAHVALKRVEQSFRGTQHYYLTVYFFTQPDEEEKIKSRLQIDKAQIVSVTKSDERSLHQVIDNILRKSSTPGKITRAELKVDQGIYQKYEPGDAILIHYEMDNPEHIALLNR